MSKKIIYLCEKSKLRWVLYRRTCLHTSSLTHTATTICIIIGDNRSTGAKEKQLIAMTQSTLINSHKPCLKEVCR